jgi:membrane protease YdiL (CAAX protease family)
MGLAVGVGAGFFEELGWTGVAVPRMLARYRLAATGVCVGLVWGAWHFLAIYWGSASALGSVPVPVYLLVALFSFLVPYRILMTWVYQRTRSTLIGVLMHASLTSSMLIMGAPVSGRDLVMYDLAFGAVLWIAAAIVLALTSRALPPGMSSEPFGDGGVPVARGQVAEGTLVHSIANHRAADEVRE